MNIHNKIGYDLEELLDLKKEQLEDLYIEIIELETSLNKALREYKDIEKFITAGENVLKGLYYREGK